MNELDKRQKSKSDYVQTVFENIAANYDMMNRIISLGLDQTWRQKSLAHISLPPNAKILDAACGTCDWTIMLAEQLSEQGQVLGADFSTEMLKIGEKKIAQRDLANKVKLVNSDVSSLPFSADQFDYVTIAFALRNLENISKTLLELKRVTKPGGKIITLDIFKPTLVGYRQLFMLYFNTIVPLLGKLIVNKYKQYQWLPESLEQFITSLELKSVFLEIGLNEITIEKLMGGAVIMHYAKK